MAEVVVDGGEDGARDLVAPLLRLEKLGIGLKTGKGFLDYGTLDIDAYRAGRLKALIDMLGFMGLSRPPVLPE